MVVRVSLLAIILLLVGCSPNAGDGHRLHDPNLNLSDLARTGDADSRIFTSYDPNGPVRWNQGWPWKFDLTGIGWDQTTTVTAITPRHVVMANHYKRAAGKTAVFHDRTGKPHRRTIMKVVSTSQFGLPSDAAVGLLDQELPESIRTYPLLEVEAEATGKLIGAHALITEQKRRIFFHQIRFINGSVVSFQFNPHLAESKRKPLVSGDSGNPSFLLSHGELALIETHTGGGPGSGPFYGSADLTTAIRKIVNELDPNYRIRTVGADKKIMDDAEAARSLMPKPAVVTPPAPTPRTGPSSGSSTSPRPRVVLPSS